MTEMATPRTVDKAWIRADLKQTHHAYRELIGEIPDGKWDATSGNRAFTCGPASVAHGLGAGLQCRAHRGGTRGEADERAVILMPLGNKLNVLRIRRGSRKATRDSVLADYERHQARLFGLLDDVTDAEFAIVKTNFAITRSVRDMFGIPVEHFAEHAPLIRSVL